MAVVDQKPADKQRIADLEKEATRLRNRVAHLEAENRRLQAALVGSITG